MSPLGELGKSTRSPTLSPQLFFVVGESLRFCGADYSFRLRFCGGVAPFLWEIAPFLWGTHSVFVGHNSCNYFLINKLCQA